MCKKTMTDIKVEQSNSTKSNSGSLNVSDLYFGHSDESTTKSIIESVKNEGKITVRQYLFDLCDKLYMVCRDRHYRTYKLINLIQDSYENDLELDKFLHRCSEEQHDPRSNDLFCLPEKWPDLTKGNYVDFKSEKIQKLEKFKKFVEYMENAEYEFVEFYCSEY